MISGLGAFTKTSTGNVTFTTPNTYIGTTAINNGSITVGVDNALPLGGNVTVGNGNNTVSLLVNNNQTSGALSILGTGSNNLSPSPPERP